MLLYLTLYISERNWRLKKEKLGKTAFLQTAIIKKTLVIVYFSPPHVFPRRSGGLLSHGTASFIHQCRCSLNLLPNGKYYLPGERISRCVEGLLIWGFTSTDLSVLGTAGHIGLTPAKNVEGLTQALPKDLTDDDTPLANNLWPQCKG